MSFEGQKKFDCLQISIVSSSFESPKQNRSCCRNLFRRITKCLFRLLPRQSGCGKYKSELPQICQRFALIDTYNGKDLQIIKSTY